MSFDKNKIARNLPKPVVIDLLHRTAKAHKNLNEVWKKAVEDEYGSAIANELKRKIWPEEKGWKSLFIDDLRFIIAAGKLKPDLLTFSYDNPATLPQNLTKLGPVFGLLTFFGQLFNGKKSQQSSKPSWTGSPNKAVTWVRGKFIDGGFIFLEWLWKKTETKTSLTIDVDAYEKQLENLSRDELELLWNYAAIAYLLVTNPWYQEVKSRFGSHMAQQFEKLVWVDLGAAEYDLDIGLLALQERGKNVESLLKGFQFAPGEVGILNVDFEIINENHGILTHKTCPAVDRLEYYEDSRLKNCCDICIDAMQLSGHMLDKNIECRPLKLPPRLDANDIACQWEYILKSS